MDNVDLRLFLNKKLRINLFVNGVNRYYNGAEIIKINDSDFMFRDRFGGLVSATISSIVKIEEIVENGGV